MKWAMIYISVVVALMGCGLSFCIFYYWITGNDIARQVIPPLMGLLVLSFPIAVIAAWLDS
jgi:hypothetical protein